MKTKSMNDTEYKAWIERMVRLLEPHEPCDDPECLVHNPFDIYGVRLRHVPETGKRNDGNLQRQDQEG